MYKFYPQQFKLTLFNISRGFENFDSAPVPGGGP